MKPVPGARLAPAAACPDPQKAAAIKRATAEARKGKLEMVVVHAPIEHAEDIDSETGVYGYAPACGAHILYRHALAGVGQPDNPARGIVARINPTGKVIYV